MASDFDPNIYTRGPIVDVPSAYSLSVAILSAVPPAEHRGALVEEAARALRGKTVELRGAWSANVQHSGVDRRPADNTSDTSWRATYTALSAVCELAGSEERDALAARATALRERLFQNGIAFTQDKFERQWAHADRLLVDIDENGLAAEIDELIGPHFLAFVRSAHTAYGEALKITEADEAAPGGLREPKRAVEIALQEYVFALFAENRPSDPANHALLRRALAPIDALREEQARRAARATGEQDPAAPPPAPDPEPDGPPDEPIPDIE